jgi:hypothetical protein
MRRVLLVCLLLNLSLPVANAQRDAPVSNSFLAGMSVYRRSISDVCIDLLFEKDGGPHEHTEHQMYLIAYLEKDEDQILKLASDRSLLNKRERNKKMLLDVLREKRLIAVLDSKVADRMVYHHGKATWPSNTFPFHFSLSNKDLFEAVNTLANFDPQNVVQSDAAYFRDRLKLLVFVPVNDSKYADKISPEIRAHGDFANWHSEGTEPGDDVWFTKTILLHFRPLPYNFQFSKDSDGWVALRIN